MLGKKICFSNGFLTHTVAYPFRISVARYTFPMQLAFCDHDDHSAIVFELTAHPDIEATLQGKRFLAKNISLEQYGKSLVLQHEDSGMITKVDILKAKNLSSLLRMTENFCGE